jgi:two-component system C4-dicarboxylate transport response regulator DctD
MSNPWTSPLDLRLPDGATVLVVEDDANVRRALRRVLELNGAVVVEAGDGGQAIEAIEEDREGRLEAVVTDLRMPVVSGSELIAVLLECRPDLPVVAVSAVDELLAAIHGAPVLHKPFTEEELVGTLAPLVTKARAKRKPAVIGALRGALERLREPAGHFKFRQSLE